MQKTFLISLTLAVAIALQISPVSAATVDVSADGETYIVDGAVIHHDRFENDRREAATCRTCHWQIHLICRSWSDTSHGACPSLSASCPRTQTVAEVLRADAVVRPPLTSLLWHMVGHTCIGEGGPASVIEIEEELEERWRIPLPPFGFVTRPPQRSLVNLPTQVIFQSGTTSVEQNASVVGIPVTFRAFSTRKISCTPLCLLSGTTLAFTTPGTTTIRGSATWRASFDALGLTDIPVEKDPIIQRASQTIEVLRLHRFLETN